MIIDTIERLMAGRTVVLITHGPGWSGGADRTLLLDRGRLVLTAVLLDQGRLRPGRAAVSATGACPGGDGGPGARPLAAAP